MVSLGNGKDLGGGRAGRLLSLRLAIRKARMGSFCATVQQMGMYARRTGTRIASTKRKHGRQEQSERVERRSV